MSMKIPHISVGIPVYNGQNFIAEAIESVLSQTYKDFELIISDNASTDETEVICRKYEQEDARIQYYRAPENRGASWNYNRVFELSQGDYFRWLAADDMLAPTLLEKSAFVLDSYPDVVLCFTWTRDIDASGEEIKIKPSTRDFAAQRPSERFYSLSITVPWHNCEEVFGLIRWRVLESSNLIGPYTDSDRTLLAQLALYGPFYEIREPLFWHRIHEAGSVVVNPQTQQRAAWFDPTLRGKLIFPAWRQAYELFRVIGRSPIAVDEKINSYFKFARWVKRRRKALFMDLRWALKNVF
jgi:glycosyltransferase involved in cell wall biosynthesis